MKTISVVIPTYNEEKNIPLIYKRVVDLFAGELKDYSYKILFIDNHSTDTSRDQIRVLAAADKDVQYIFNIKNFGFNRSTFYGLTQSVGDASVLLFADMQDPPELIADFVREWEGGCKFVAGIKNRSKESSFKYFVRKVYYKFINGITDIEHIDQFTGFGLYDASVIKTLARLEDPLPYLRGIVAELGPDCKKIYYTQNVRQYGKTSFSFNKLYDTAMLGITSYSKTLMRTASFIGIIIALISFILTIVTIICKLTGSTTYPTGTAAILCGVFFFGGLQLLFIGVLGEYISNINIRTMKRPLVVEEERGGFDE